MSTQGELFANHLIRTSQYNDGLPRPEDVIPVLPKALGAYYTDTQVAEFLVKWAVRSPSDTILDPSFGGGVFLRAAAHRLTSLGGSAESQIFGIEIDKAVHGRIGVKLTEEFQVRRANLRVGDFFDQNPIGVDVVVGNPPFIRFHSFTGQSRKRATERLAENGWKISELSSSWLPFVLCSILQLKPHGRLSMVVPAELVYAGYARIAFDALLQNFAKVRFLSFRKKLFADLNEDTLLLLAEDYGSGPAKFYLRDVAHAGLLGELDCSNSLSWRAMKAEELAAGQSRITDHYIPAKARDLYRKLSQDVSVARLGDLADVGIGYVTGANGYFHLSPDEARIWDIERKFLRPAVRRGRSLAGTRFTASDWETGLSHGQRGFLVQVNRDDEVSSGLGRYLEHGRRLGVHNGYKCRMRKPWYCVPHVHRPDALLSYMSGSAPRMVANDANVVAPNSLHVVRLHERTPLNVHRLAALWQTSLTLLSAELEGHSMGGGMLKLEPTEAERVLIAAIRGSDADGLVSELDTLLRSGRDRECSDLADNNLLIGGLGLSKSDCLILNQAASSLRERRAARSN
jgi:adenine-specific DNA methylase